MRRFQSLFSPRGRPVWPGLWLLLWMSVAGAMALNPDRSLNEYQRRYWSIEHGLPPAAIKAVTQNQDGYLWVATEMGLARFNGDRFETWTEKNAGALAGRMVNCLLAAQDGSLWGGGVGGELIRHRAGSFSHYWLGTGKNVIINCLVQDRRGRKWLGTSIGAFYMDATGFHPFAGIASAKPTAINAILEDSQGGIWFGSEAGLYGPMISESAPLEKHPREFSRVKALCDDGKGGLWAGGSEGLLHVMKDRQAFYDRNRGLKDSRIQALLRDSQGVLWVGTAQGITRIRSEQVIMESEMAGLGGGGIWGFFEDKEGNFWIAGGSGLHCLNDRVFTSYSNREELRGDFLCITEGNPGTVLVGSMEDGFYELSGGKARRSLRPSSLLTVTSLLQDSQGGLWIGSRRGGVDYLAPGRAVNYRTNYGLLDNNIFAIHEDAKGQIWIGTEKGLHRQREKEFEPVSLQGTNELTVRFINSARDATLWIGTSKGLFSMQSGAVDFLPLPGPRAAPLVYCVQEDQEGRIWLGTANGLACRTEAGWRFFGQTEQDSFHVFWVVDDRLGHIWFSTPWSIFRIAKADLFQHWQDASHPANARMFTQADGLTEMGTVGGRQSAGCRSQDGKLWFLTRRGAAVADPSRLTKNTVPPEVVIEKLTVDGRPAAMVEPVVLPVGTRQVEFQYAGLSFAAPGKVQYRYRLSDVDPGWRDAGNRRVVTYANLKSGPYLFQVTACNNDGVWKTGGAVLNFSILPHFYETAWFYALVATGMAGSAIGFDFWRMRRLRAQKKQLERMVQERTGELERQAVQRLELEARLQRARQLEVVGQLAAGMAHHFNNLLTIIQGNLSFLRDESGKTRDNEFLIAIEKAAIRAAGLVRQLLAFGQRHWLQRTEVDLNELVQHQVGRLRPDLPVGVELEVESAPSLPKLFVDPEMIGQILDQLIQNSRDALSGGGKIGIRTSRVEITASQAALIPESVPGTWVVLAVEDNGTGMTDEVRSHLWEPFYTTKDVGRGTGLGLASVYGIVKQHHGWLDIRSTLGKGTEVRVYLPAGEPVPVRY